VYAPIFLVCQAQMSPIAWDQTAPAALNTDDWDQVGTAGDEIVGSLVGTRTGRFCWAALRSCHDAD
jgi:hypothetical protein